MARPGREEALRTQEEALRTRAPGPGGAAGPGLIQTRKCIFGSGL